MSQKVDTVLSDATGTLTEVKSWKGHEMVCSD